MLASAEKFVQQGKLQNAIAEYEKVIKEDPKDLTVLNTIGDLYARVGHNEQAAHYFRNVADQYAQNGFTVKAIAIYKKLTKISPGNLDNITKLAELYTQQGLFNDARQQFMQVADHLLKAGDNPQAARVFQRILELDPENVHTQSKLADLYMKLGKKEEARNIYFSAAESLHSRGSYDAAEEALGKVLTLDPTNTAALMLRGMIAANSGDNRSAVHYLEQVPDLDSRPDGLQTLLRIKQQSGDAAGMEVIAGKLLTLHNDASGVAAVAQWYTSNNRVNSALKLYDKYADRLVKASPGMLKDALHPLMTRIKDDPQSLALMQSLLQKAGDTSQTAEILELQANACAKKGEFAAARDLYQQLSEMEPENTLHTQNFRQMQAKLGEDSATRILTPEEAAQAFMVEELDQDSAVVQQHYDPPVESALEAALTDAELFVSYNVPMKAIAPLESVLPLAPRDITVNQRLATLYARAERYADAARVCQVLSDVYLELGHSKESAKYLEAHRKYALRAPSGPAAVVPMRSAPPPPPPPPPMPVRPEPERFSPLEIPLSRAPDAHVETAPHVELGVAPEVASPAVGSPEAGAEAASIQEFSFDVAEPLLADHESLPPVSVHEAPVPPPALPVVADFATPTEHAPPVHAHADVEEADQSDEWESMLSVEHEETETVSFHTELEVMPPHAEPDHDLQPDLKPVFAAGKSSTFYAIEDKVQEIQFYISQQMWDEAKTAVLNLAELAPDAPEVTQLMSQVAAGRNRAAAGAPPAPSFAEPGFAEPHFAEPHFEPELAPIDAVVHEPEAPANELQLKEVPVKLSPDDSAVLDIPPEIVPPVAVPPPAPPAAKAPVLQMPPPQAAPPSAAMAGQSTEDILNDFLHDLEQSDLADFVPRPQGQPEQPARWQSTSPGAHAAASVSERAIPVAQNGDMQDAESANVLNDILNELQEETAGAPEPEEDPETHYNLGIAFKEMGLLDEAIGELQKVCHAIDRGHPFSQPVQAYTWLAQCLVDKGAPEAAVRWYQKALTLPGMDSGSRCSVYYDLASAFEASGDKKSALANFMEVYGSNIDFRDVASRIKALKA